MRLQLILPTVETTKIEPPTICMFPDCNGTSLQLKQTVKRQLRDIIHQRVNVYRYRCLRCKRSFTVYPEGVSRKIASHRVKCLAIILYLLGLSYSAVSTVLKALGISESKSQVYYDVHAAIIQSPDLVRENIFEGVRIAGKDAAATDVKYKGQWKPLELRKDSLRGLSLSIDQLSGEDARSLKEKVKPIAEHLGAQILVKEPTEPLNKVVKKTENKAKSRPVYAARTYHLRDWRSVNLFPHEILNSPVEYLQVSSDQALPFHKTEFHLRLLNSAAIILKNKQRTGLSTHEISLLYLFSIIFAEVITLLLAPLLGLIFHGVLLVSLLLHAGSLHNGALRRLLIALTFVPLIRLLSLPVPLYRFSPLYDYLVIGIPLAVAAFLAARTMKMRAAKLGLSGHRLSQQVLFAFFGIGLGYLQYQILQPNPLIAELRLEQILLPALIMLAVTGFLEEFVFRGLMQTAAVQFLGGLGIIYTSVLFAVMHLGYQSAPEFLFVFGVGMIFGLFREFTDSVLGVALAHGIANITLYLILPFTLPLP